MTVSKLVGKTWIREDGDNHTNFKSKNKDVLKDIVKLNKELAVKQKVQAEVEAAKVPFKMEKFLTVAPRISKEALTTTALDQVRNEI